MSERAITPRAPYFAFEGGEGCGKSTQLKLAESYLKQKGYSTLFLREPGTGRIPEAIRAILLDPDFKEMNDVTEFLLYSAARAQTFGQFIIPALNSGKIVVADRSFVSSMVYQGDAGGGKIPQEIISLVSKIAMREIMPDLVFLFDIGPQEGLKVARERAALDRIESRDLQYHEKVNEGYRKIAAQDPTHFRVVPYIPGGIEQMQSRVREEMDKYIEEKGLEKVIARL